jgi:hypothetical protein
MTSQSSLLGAAGEHYVLCQLLRRGYIAALAPQGVPNADIIVTDELGDKLCAIQVKTRRDIGSDGGWHMKGKHEGIVSKNLFYCFVDFGKKLTDTPSCHIIPSATVAKVLRDSHQSWLSTPGRGGKAHKDGDMRRFLPDYQRKHGDKMKGYGTGWLEPYKDAWDALKKCT